MKTKKPFNSHCAICKEPCHAPKGNWNINRVSLCHRTKCRRQRKTELQREARRQRELFADVKRVTKKGAQKAVVRRVARALRKQSI
jgi:hypothetical protein